MAPTNPVRVALFCIGSDSRDCHPKLEDDKVDSQNQSKQPPTEYCKHYSQGIVVFLVSNSHVDSKLLTDDYLDQLSGVRYCISRPAIGCLSYTHILSRYELS